MKLEIKKGCLALFERLNYVIRAEDHTEINGILRGLSYYNAKQGRKFKYLKKASRFSSKLNRYVTNLPYQMQLYLINKIREKTIFHPKFEISI